MIGFTVNRYRPAIGFVVADDRIDPSPVLVPPFSFGDPFGSSWVVAMLNGPGPFANPSTRRT